AEQKREDGIQETSGVVGGSDVCGFECDDRKPNGRRQPNFDDALGGCVQTPILISMCEERFTLLVPSSHLSRQKSLRNSRRSTRPADQESAPSAVPWHARVPGSGAWPRRRDRR